MTDSVALNDNSALYDKALVNMLKVHKADNQHNKSYHKPDYYESSHHKLSYQATDLKDKSPIIYNHKNEAPIGLFDSGIGGLSVYKHLAEQLPAERYIYYADTKHVPYGDRDSQDIEALTLRAVEWLYSQGCKLIVIACNSASAHALEVARFNYPQLPIVGLVPALKPAVIHSESGKVAVLATKATLQGALLNQVITEIATPKGCSVIKYFDPYLVPWVEAGMPEHSQTAKRLKQLITNFASEGVDYLVLGCTHYPFFKTFLLQEIEAQNLSLQVVDSGQAIAARVQDLLITNNLSNNTVTSSQKVDAREPLIFYASKYDSQLLKIVPRLVGTETSIDYKFQ